MVKFEDYPTDALTWKLDIVNERIKEFDVSLEEAESRRVDAAVRKDVDGVKSALLYHHQVAEWWLEAVREAQAIAAELVKRGVHRPAVNFG